MVYTEAELIIPALQIMKETPSGVKTSLLIGELTRILNPTGHDSEIIKGRVDTYFSQKVRNLKSHDTLIRRGLATYEGGRNGIYTITDKGIKLIEENKLEFESALSQGFTKSQIGKEIDNDFSGIIIEEGGAEERTVIQRQRCAKLRRVAIRECKNENNGRLICKACEFDFERSYGEHGKDFIEIHHTELICEMDISGSRHSLEDALNKVAPLCSNCHRMVHRKRGEMLSIGNLKDLIRKSKQSGLGSF